MKLSVIIPCYNAEATLGATLASLTIQEWDQPWEVLVVDNRSTDGSAALAERFRARLPNLRVVCAGERAGVAYARNVGVREAQAEAVAFCDADDEVGAGWVAAMGAALERHGFVAASIDVAKLNAGWILQSRGNNQRSGLQPYRYPPYLPHAGAGTMGLRRAVFFALGGFDESLACLEDTDLSWRAQLAGVELQFVPEAVVHVRYRASMGALFRQARTYARFNVLLYKRYRKRGMPPISLRMSARSWWQMLRRLRTVRDKGSFGLWLWYFAQRLGRLEGSIKYRVRAF